MLQSKGVRMRYTVRNVPPSIDREIRGRSNRSGKSLNETLVDTLRKGLAVHNDLDDLFGTWKSDEEFDRAVREQDVVDEDTWR